MARRFSRGLDCNSGYTVPSEVTVQKACRNDEFLILLLLFILLAASPAMGLNSSYFFIIIMTVIGLGGVSKAFGLSR